MTNHSTAVLDFMDSVQTFTYEAHLSTNFSGNLRDEDMQILDELWEKAEENDWKQAFNTAMHEGKSDAFKERDRIENIKSELI